MPDGILPPEIKKELSDFFSRWSTYILYVFLGMLAHFSNIVLSKKRMSWLQTFASIGFAFVCGVIAAMVCAKYYPDSAVIAVPFFTLVSDKVFAYITAMDWQNLFDNLVTALRPKK